MKIKKKRSETGIPQVNTSALPDIIFMLLFFFMVVTVLRKHEVMLSYELPEAEQIKKLKHPSIHHHLYVGEHELIDKQDKKYIQLNDKFVELDEISSAVRQLIITQPEHFQDKINTCLRADVNQWMDLLSKVKVELRKAKQYNMAYVAE